MKIELKRKLYHIKNSIKFFFKRNLNSEDIKAYERLIEGGYMSRNTYIKLISRKRK